MLAPEHDEDDEDDERVCSKVRTNSRINVNFRILNFLTQRRTSRGARGGASGGRRLARARDAAGAMGAAVTSLYSAAIGDESER